MQMHEILRKETSILMMVVTAFGVLLMLFFAKMLFDMTNYVGSMSKNVEIMSREIVSLNTKFNLTRKASVIFELVLIMLNLKPGGKIFAKEWKYLQDDVDEWNQNPRLHIEFNSPFKYVSAKYAEDPAIKTTIGIIVKYGGVNVYKAYDYAKTHEKDKNNKVTLCTAHSSKGLEFDLVDLTEDLNLSIERIIKGDSIVGKYNEKELETLRLYYVACSRATKKLRNADWLML